MTTHKQVFTMVQTHADEGIKDLVELMNHIEGLMTFESCEGNVRHPQGESPAVIFFRVFDKSAPAQISWFATCKLIFNHLAPRLNEECGDSCSFEVSTNTHGTHTACFIVRPGALPAAEQFFRDYLNQTKGLPNE